MNRKEVALRMALFEQQHPVEDYVCFDWHVWPLLRVQISYEAFIKDLSKDFDYKHEKKNESEFCWSQFRLVRVIKRLLDKVPSCKNALTTKYNDQFGNDHPVSVKGDVVFLTLSSRRLNLNGRLYEIYSDPIVSELQSLGVSTLVWERGVPNVPRHSHSFMVDQPLHAALEQLKEQPPIPEPHWFREFTKISKDLLERDLQWIEVEAWIRRLQQTSIVFEQWLQAVGAKLLVSVCWYDPSVMAATLAANRLGVVSVDLQHGVQDKSHFAYGGWERGPLSGYGIIPQIFWSWGESQAKQLNRNNPAFRKSNFIIGGNIWLNAWKNGKDSLINETSFFDPIKNLLLRSSKRILVTFQGYDGYDDLVLGGIEKSPPGWLWLIRFHPATFPDVASRRLDRLKAFDNTRVEHTLTTQLPLYALLKVCDVHITGHSTCALEALAFGKPTIIVSQDGFDSYRDYIEKGVMAFAKDEEKLIHLLADFAPTPLQCELAAQLDFASPLMSSQVLVDLLDKAGIKSKLAADKDL